MNVCIKFTLTPISIDTHQTRNFFETSNEAHKIWLFKFILQTLYHSLCCFWFQVWISVMHVLKQKHITISHCCDSLRIETQERNKINNARGRKRFRGTQTELEWAMLTEHRAILFCCWSLVCFLLTEYYTKTYLLRSLDDSLWQDIWIHSVNWMK